MPDVLKVLEDLKYKAVGIDPNNKAMPEGYFVSFCPIGIPIPKEDYENPWTPTGSQMKEILASKPKTPDATPAVGQDPATIAAVSASKALDDINYVNAGISASFWSFLQTFNLTDEKIVLDSTYRPAPGGGKVNDTWFAIINGANGIAPDMELNDELKKSVDNAHAVLADKDGNVTPHYEKYLQYRDAYQEAVRTRDKQYANAFSDPQKLALYPIQGKSYQDDVDLAWDQWQSLGFKQEIEEATAVLSSQGIDPAILLIARAKHKYENSLVTIPNLGNIPYTYITPSRWYSPNNDQGWNFYSQSDFHSETHFDAQTSHTAASGGFSVGFFHVGGSGGSDTQRTDLNIQTEGLTIEFEYATATIQRPWLDTSILGLSNWFLVGDYPANCISDGSFNQQFNVNSPTITTFLPSIITGLVLARNVKIKWNKTAAHTQTLQSAASGGGFVGIGPFVVAANHSQTHTKNDFTYDDNSQGISIDGVQLIGYVSAIMPGSPRKNGKDFQQKKKDPATPAGTANTGAVPTH